MTGKIPPAVRAASQAPAKTEILPSFAKDKFPTPSRQRALPYLALAGLLVALATPLPSHAQQVTDAIAPESGSATNQMRQAVKSHNWMISAANPLAVQAGADVLRRGGNAIDAMVAVQTMLGLVEPQSSGLGGGSFMVYYDAANQKLTTMDARETAPMAADENLFMGKDGEPLKFYDAVVGGRSVGTPGTPMLLEKAHQKWGQMAWPSLFEMAIDRADKGFLVSPRLAELLKEDGDRLKKDPETAAYFLDADGNPLPAGKLLKNPQYANTLRTLAQGGADAFYNGPIADAIVKKVQGASWNPGLLSQADLSAYDVKERDPVCSLYRGYDVCGMGPPSSGALTVGQILGMIEPYDIGKYGPYSATSWRLIGDASRLAFADRGRYMADSDFVPMNLKGLVDPGYLAQRARLLDRGLALPANEVKPGNPPQIHASNWGDDNAIEFPCTSHFSIVDSWGNVVSMTTTIENGFGSRLMTNGFLLNNELTDFSFKPVDANGMPVANRVEPGKRPRSSMSPTIVMQGDKPVIATGSPGGSRIIGYVAQSIIAMIDWGMDPQQAAAMPHLVNRFGTFDVEAGTEAASLAPNLTAAGFDTKITDLNSGLHIIKIGPDGLTGGADPRREGIVMGE
ncbi:gamma-glutamyltransferase [Thalassospira marina]|uniref:Glutathione hydrolase proenzyme n=1 Tax=Thalassospira marina TaxID=2048283 RepID=A0A2N3KV85_9PROT|nr:gamma-glutamyltransferase [Thalassospira marina]PKR54475.1 gamma-glutamyltransferase [Thalassospira marina]